MTPDNPRPTVCWRPKPLPQWGIRRARHSDDQTDQRPRRLVWFQFIGDPGACGKAPAIHHTSVMREQDSALTAELLAMAAEQKEVVTRTGGGAVGPVPVEHRRQQREVFVRHADRLRDILQEHGWPTAEQVGSGAAHAAWIVAQHADT